MEHLPEIYQDFQQLFPEIAEAHNALAGQCREWGPLDDKSQRLVKLGVAIGLGAEGAVKSHARRALEEGFTPEALRHAVLLAFTTAGFPDMVAALKWVNEVITRHK